jgi:hypothetical protein
MIEDYLECSRINSEFNEKKAKRLDEAQTAFLGAMIIIPIAAVLAIITRLMS